jgi:hypothetical protein
VEFDRSFHIIIDSYLNFYDNDCVRLLSDSMLQEDSREGYIEVPHPALLCSTLYAHFDPDSNHPQC